MTTTDGGVTFDDGQVAGITADVWSAFTDLSVVPAGPPAMAGGETPCGETAVGTVRVEGAWRGCVTVACPPSLARRAAAAMLASPADALDDGDVADALGELTNMIGGNVKSLLPAPSTLCLPTVTLGAAGPPAVDGVLAHRTTMTCDDVPLTVSVWRTERAGGGGGESNPPAREAPARRC